MRRSRVLSYLCGWCLLALFASCSGPTISDLNLANRRTDEWAAVGLRVSRLQRSLARTPSICKKNKQEFSQLQALAAQYGDEVEHPYYTLNKLKQDCEAFDQLRSRIARDVRLYATYRQAFNVLYADIVVGKISSEEARHQLENARKQQEKLLVAFNGYEQELNTIAQRFNKEVEGIRLTYEKQQAQFEFLVFQGELVNTD
jgi:chromosome segregation ATPase